MTSNEIFEIIEDLNTTCFENSKLDYYSPFEYLTCGWSLSVIKFMDVTIWSDDDDMRDYIEDTDEREPLRDFLIKEAIKIVDDLNNKMKPFRKEIRLSYKND